MPLMTTKLHIPPIRPDLVPRARLVQRLNDSLQQEGGSARKLALISAPAGFGKTTLLSKWAHCGKATDPPLRVAWFSLDEGDNDPARFLAYLITSLQTIEEQIGHGIMGALRSPGFAKTDTSLSLEELLTTFINQIDAIPYPFALVLDDYHVIETQTVHDALTFLLDHLPPSMHLVIATRTDPPLPIARLRGQGQVTELRQAELCFTPAEATEFLNRMMRLDLPAEDVAALSARTEGWIAGLQMASIAIQARLAQSHLPENRAPSAELARAPGSPPGQGGIPGFIQALSGSDRFIMDYLVEEVLHQQPENIQAFLLQTAILDRLTGPLCDAVVTNHQLGKLPAGQITADTSLMDLPFADLSGQEMLEYLEQANLFVVPLDERREWYRYHHLFADLLRQRLGQVRPDLVPTLHLRASEWYERYGHVDAAIAHALSAGNQERAADLIEQAAEATWMHSQVTTFLGWVDALPGEILRARPMLGIYQAMALLMGAHPLDEVEARLQRTAGNRAADPVSGGMAVCRALVAAYQGRAAESAELSQQALAILPEESLFLRSLVAGILGLAHLYGGDVKAAVQALENAAKVSQQAGNLMNTVLALCHLADLSMLQGELREAKRCFAQALELAVDGQGQRLPIAGLALIGLGQILLERNDLDSAARHLTEGIDLMGQWGEAGTLRGYSALARVARARGDLGAARRLLQTAEQIALRFDAMEMDDRVVAMQQAQISIVEGDLEAARRWAKGRGLETKARPAEAGAEDAHTSFAHRYMRTIEGGTLARLLIARGRQGSRDSLERASALLERLVQSAEAEGWTRNLIEFLALRALALQALGRQTEALAGLERALSLAQPEGYIRVFADEDPPMADLLRQARSRGLAPAYVSRLLGALSPWEQRVKVVELPDVVPPVDQPLVDPLTQRELEVLRLLNSHLSSTEIAEQLYISANTVRSHIKNIYSKLQVHRRVDAVHRALDLSLL